MSRPFPDPRWHREYTDGRSRLTVEHTLDGRVHFAVHDIDTPGYSASIDRATAEAIAEFIRSAT